ncbi:hypothetical protein CKAH01_00268 [Colletotrichum kahawae]|uniref:Uncharacterized protein n=1 Tax=Colletotrichum kahawae TaxID=34407 RepID=A0AAD9YZ24_COLKA|nr:hypothetical protein CKAH01_00268 [Colletotrichum kahawae]
MHRAHRGLVYYVLSSYRSLESAVYLPVLAGPRAGAVQIVLPGARALKARREEEEKGRPEAVDTAPGGGPGHESGGGKADQVAVAAVGTVFGRVAGIGRGQGGGHPAAR